MKDSSTCQGGGEKEIFTQGYDTETISRGRQYRITPGLGLSVQYSAYDLELLTVYSTTVKFRHILEGRCFKIFTDQKPLTSAFFKSRDPVSNRQRQQLAFISEFATEIAHIPSLENVVAYTLTRQYDNLVLEAPAVVHAVTHTLADVDLSEIAQIQPRIEDQPPSSLKLEAVKFSGVDQPVVCDTWLGRPRVLVPGARSRSVFDAVHSLSHPSGKATLAIIAHAYA